VLGFDEEGHADAHVERSQHLARLELSQRRQPAKHWRHAPLRHVQVDSDLGCQHARDVLQQSSACVRTSGESSVCERVGTLGASVASVITRGGQRGGGAHR
jgi:hypothetical protein